jgi:predicted RNA-binding protein YlxR (DUF448 family)
MAKHVPLRRCTSCRQSLPKTTLIRLYQDQSGQWQLDTSSKAGGRGYWLCKRAECHQLKVLKRNYKAQAERVAGLLSDWSAAQAA